MNHNPFDPLNWPVPEPNFIFKSYDDGIFQCPEIRQCGEYWHPYKNPDHRGSLRAYTRHWYLHHDPLTQNWSA